MFFLFAFFYADGQEMQIKENNKALNLILIEIRDSYNINISFNDKELSKYNITINENFKNPDEAFHFLLKDVPISFEKSGNVYLFFPNKTV